MYISRYEINLLLQPTILTNCKKRQVRKQELFIFRQMGDKSIQQPKGKILVAPGGRQISLAIFLIKIGLHPEMHRFFSLLSHQ